MLERGPAMRHGRTEHVPRHNRGSPANSRAHNQRLTLSRAQCERETPTHVTATALAKLLNSRRTRQPQKATKRGIVRDAPGAPDALPECAVRSVTRFGAASATLTRWNASKPARPEILRTDSAQDHALTQLPHRAWFRHTSAHVILLILRWSDGLVVAWGQLCRCLYQALDISELGSSGRHFFRGHRAPLHDTSGSRKDVRPLDPYLCRSTGRQPAIGFHGSADNRTYRV